MGDSQRSTKMQNLEHAWTSIDEMLKSAKYGRMQSVLDTAAQYNDEQPILHAANLRPDPPFRDHRGAVDLTDVVTNTEALIRMVRNRIQHGDFRNFGGSEHSSRMAPLLASSNRHIASLQTMIRQLQQDLAQIKDANEREARGLYIRMATSAIEEDSRDGKTPATLDRRPNLCPLTPAQLLQQENRLVQSLEEVSMKELTVLAADSVRRSNQKKEKERLSSDGLDQESLLAETSVDPHGAFRKLEYGEGDDGHDMEP